MISKPIERAPEYLRSVNPNVAECFSHLRQAVYQSGSLDIKTRELILLGAFATVGYEMPFKNHALRIKNLGVSLEEVQQAVMITLGSTTTLKEAAAALSWADAVFGVQR